MNQQNCIVTTTFTFTPDKNPDGTPTGLFITGPYNAANQKLILQNLGILCDGKYRENLLDAGVYNYMEKYHAIGGKGAEGLYCYNFALKTSPFVLQPSGAMNMSKFKDIEFEFTTFTTTKRSKCSISYYLQ